MSLVVSPSHLAEKKWSPRIIKLKALYHPAERRWSAAVVLFALCGFLFFYGLSAGELYRNETLRAIIAAEFLRSGNWIVPTLYGEPLFTKPPGMYTAIALASWPAGAVSEWTARLPSAIAATGTVFLVYWYFSRQLGRLGGLVAALLLPVSFMWLDKASSAEIDMLQGAWVTAAVLFFLRALEEEDGETERLRDKQRKKEEVRVPFDHAFALSFRVSTWFWWMAALGCVAGGVLTKWTAPVFFYGTVVPLLWWRGQLRLLLKRHHLASAAVGASICLAWVGAAVALAGWDTFYGTVSQEALVRLSPSHHQAPNYHTRPEPWQSMLVHPFRVWMASLPVSAFALPALWPGFARRWDERGRRLLQALHCWIWPNLCFWSLIPEHGVRHSFPLVPGIAGLAALVWVAWLTGRLPWRMPRVAPEKVLVGMLALWLVVKLAFVHVAIPERNRKREPRAKGEQIRAQVPAGKVLYLFRLKDEGIMFYYGRTVRRLSSPGQLPSSSEPLYCILDEIEWQQWQRVRPVEVILPLRDEQGARIVLVRVTG